MVHVCCLEKICDEAVDWQTAAEGFPKHLEPVQDFGERQEASAETHSDGLCVRLDRLVRNIHRCFAAA